MDFNHPLADKELHFMGEVVDVRLATLEELQHGHVHGAERDVNAIPKYDTRGQTCDIRRIFCCITEESSGGRTAELRLQCVVQRHAAKCAYLDADQCLRKRRNYCESDHDTDA